MLKLRSLTLLFVTALLLTACGSSPRSTHYVLTADARGAPSGNSPSLGIGPVSIPDYLKTRELVLNRNANELELARFDRWAEPLDSGITRVVAVNLAVLLDTQSVSRFPWRRNDVPDYAVQINVAQFAAQGNQALLVVEWSVTDPETSETITQQIDRYTTSTGSGTPTDVAAGYSDLLLQFSREIAGIIENAQER